MRNRMLSMLVTSLLGGILPASSVSAEDYSVKPEPNNSVISSAFVQETSSADEIQPIRFSSSGETLVPMRQSAGGCLDDYWYGNNSNGRKWGGNIFGYSEFWRGVPDDDWPGNLGGATGLNLGRQFSDGPWGMQMGGSFGLYDLRGRAQGAEGDQAQTQTFLTGGFFRKASSDSPFSAGVVYDLMINNNFGYNSREPFLTQYRTQLAYHWSANTELGTWVAFHDRTATFSSGPFFTRSFEAINTYNLYIKHRFEGGAIVNTWLGTGDNHRLDQPGSVYSATFGANWTVPISDRFSVYSQTMIGIPSGRPSEETAYDETGSLAAGFVFYPRRNGRACSTGGAAWTPYMPVANNGTFLVDASTPFN